MIRSKEYRLTDARGLINHLNTAGEKGADVTIVLRLPDDELDRFLEKYRDLTKVDGNEVSIEIKSAIYDPMNYAFIPSGTISVKVDTHNEWDIIYFKFKDVVEVKNGYDWLFKGKFSYLEPKVKKEKVNMRSLFKKFKFWGKEKGDDAT